MLSVLKANKSKASASVVDGKLILSFPHAQTPVLWQMDLAQAKASAIEVLKAEKGTDFTLTLKTQKGEKVIVASFETREEALEGLMAASKALENAHGNIQIAANEDQKIAHARPAKKAGKGQWLTGILSVLALIILFGLWSSIAPRPPSGYQGTSATDTAAAQQNSAAQSTGVPVSADDFLNGL